MIRMTITIDDDLAAEIDGYVAHGPSANRSEAIRDLVRRGLAALPQPDPAAECIGVLSCAVDQSMPGLSKRLREARMSRHNEIMFSASVPVNHDETIDIAVVRGTVARVDQHARSLFVERGVRHGALSLMPVAEEAQIHAHGNEAPHSHSHLRIGSSF